MNNQDIQLLINSVVFGKPTKKDIDTFINLNNIKGYSGLTKTELINMVRNHIKFMKQFNYIGTDALPRKPKQKRKSKYTVPESTDNINDIMNFYETNFTKKSKEPMSDILSSGYREYYNI